MWSGVSSQVGLPAIDVPSATVATPLHASCIKAVWTPYTPTCEGARPHTNPNIGNGTLLGRYQILGPKTCAVRVQYVWGSNTTVGSGVNYTWDLPFPASAVQGNQAGTAEVFLLGFYPGLVVIGGTIFELYHPAEQLGLHHRPGKSVLSVQHQWGRCL